MVKNRAVSVEQHLDQLPPERREVVAAVRRSILDHLPRGYVESVSFGMLSYCIPLSAYPNTYNSQPLFYAGLAAQKNYYALHLASVYSDPATESRLRHAFAAAGRKLDMGKSCIRFKKLEDLPLAAIGDIIAATPPERHIAVHEAARATAAARRKT
jgi:hypothetical protein